MRNIYKYYYLLMLVALVNLTMSTAIAQNDQDVIKELEEKFKTYTRSFPREEVFVHTDREEYIAGEEVFFASYVMDRQSFNKSLNSKIVYVELLNSDNIPVLQRKFEVKNGTGPGSMELPDTLSTGVYRLAAYTSWMRNFLPDNCFTKELKVYNLLKDEMAGIRQIQDHNTTKNLKQYLNTGISFNVDRKDKDSIIMDIQADDDFIGPVHMIIQSHGNLVFKHSYPVSHGTRIAFASSVLLPGINQVTLFTNDGKPVAERLLFSPLRAGKINLECGDTLGIRERISINLSAPGMKTVSGQFSISVAPGSVSGIDINEYMVAGTEFGISYTDISGGVEMQEIPVNYADSILSGLSSNWINWENIVDAEYPEPKYPMENEYHYLTGTIKNEINRLDSSIFIFLCSPGKNAFFRYALCDTNGRFSFAVGLNNDFNNYILIPEVAGGSVDIAIESPFISLDQRKVSSVVDAAGIPGYIPKWSVNYQVNKLYEPPDSTTKSKPANGNENIRFYGTPDFELVMDDYISLPLMDEVFFEILPNVSVRTRKAKREIIITDRVDNMPYQSVPCLMIDGIIIKDADLIINMDPELVEKIDVIKEKYIVGKYVFPGIVNVITRKADFSDIEMPAYMKRITYRVSDIPTSFSLPDTSVSYSRIPDYRNTLYWDPALNIKSKSDTAVTFRTSDNASDYTILIQGFTEDGELVSEEKLIRVLF